MIIFPNIIDLVKGGSQGNGKQSKMLEEQIVRLETEASTAEITLQEQKVMMEKMSDD